ncbi:zinc finger protein Xfin isoform X1 [Gadus chalcogrammus]|uniref:zinc finger protein Xfin isoform X1 n=1 Tax=Gadus chalcogrammus TaxID=1042646 RepID=UPI0024C4937B|nr:zinc finger protein Xfin isoform X1 [Gadus chalcogrammus]
MLGLQGNASSSKVYRCMACSATFTGLSTLLVHQATHANALTKVHSSETSEKAQPEEAVHGSNPQLDQPTPPPPLPECPSFYICDCGEEFRDFNLMLVHKRSHISTQQRLQPLNSNIFHSVKEEYAQDTSAHLEPLRKTFTLPVVSMSYPSTSVSLTSEVVTSRDPVIDSTLPNHNVVGINLEEAIVSNPPDKKGLHADSNTQEANILSVQEPRPTAIQASSSNVKAFSIPSMTTTQAGKEPKNKNLMKMLATAYMSRFQASKSENPSQEEVVPKNENIPFEITSETASDPTPTSISLLRTQIGKSRPKSKSPTVGKILDSSKKSIVSLTQTFSPVVLLETRQKLIDSSSNGTCGRYQCGRCRKVFQDLDSLTEHHFLHRKERIKCCRYCKQLIIGKLPFPDNHICAQSAGIAIHNSNAKQKTLPFVQKTAIFHSLKQQSIINKAKKAFFCPVCKHSYARRYNLKMHKCQGPISLSQHATSPIAKKKTQSSESKVITNAQVDEGSQNCKSVAVGTAVIGNIKVEVTPPSSGHQKYPDVSRSGSANSFLPFYPRPPVQRQPKDVIPGNSLLQQVEKESRDTAVVPQQEDNGGQWRVPLDDEMEELECTMGTGDDYIKSKKTIPVATVNKTQKTGLSFFIRDGAKRYPCNKCQKTYSRPSTLRRHLRLCGFRPHGTVTAQHQNTKVHNVLGPKSQFSSKVNPIFNCIFCGKTFNRKDNMVTHRRKCQIKRAMPGMNSGALQQNLPVIESEGQRQQPQDESANWGVMSLPSVLPRRVTCECGAGFTSPKLLLEHLQKHAQESYTCPTCGETVASWADYEVHLQIHMHPHNHLYKGLQPQRSQPLLLRFQQPLLSKSVPKPQLKQPRLTQPSFKHPQLPQLPTPVKKLQRIVCMRCNNTFSNHCNLRKHITLNRCKGGRATVPPKGGHCSRCNTNFHSIISLVFHQRSGACKLAVKPVRCNICLRWFGTEDGLQKHLLTHKQSQTVHCDVCQGSYSSLKSLKNHRRKIHGIRAGGHDALPLAVPKLEKSL